jgi:predicted nucleotidyltransferase component of viral defense system
MISKEEIGRISVVKNLDASQIEKDYVLGWMLAAIAQNKRLANTWIFKGGTCIRKCYFEDYRYSEDLDFTVDRAFDLEAIRDAIHNASLWIYKNSGIDIDVTRSLFDAVRNPSNQFIIQGRIFYHGPISPVAKRQWPRIKFDITSDEIVAEPSEQRSIIHPYSDYSEIHNLKVATYSLTEILAEKIRALFERTRPRDLYDVVEIFNMMPELNAEKLKLILKKKCSFKKISCLDLSALKTDACIAGWQSQLSKQLQELPSFEYYLNQFNQIYIQLGLNNLF